MALTNAERQARYRGGGRPASPGPGTAGRRTGGRGHSGGTTRCGRSWRCRTSTGSGGTRCRHPSPGPRPRSCSSRSASWTCRYWRPSSCPGASGVTARPPATASGWRPRSGAGADIREAVDACGVVLPSSDPPPGTHGWLVGRSGARSCGTGGVSTRCARPPRCYGPPGDTPPAPRLGWQLWALRPGLDARVPTIHYVPGTRRATELRTPRRTGTVGSGSGSEAAGTAGFPAVGAGVRRFAVSKEVDVLTEPTGGPFSRGRRGPFFGCHFHVTCRGVVDGIAMVIHMTRADGRRFVEEAAVVNGYDAGTNQWDIQRLARASV